MSASFNPALSTERDWVRALVGDTDVAAPALQDETIDAVLTEEANKYLAAARCGEMVLARWKVDGADVIEKQVGQLRLRRSEGTAETAYRDHLKGLREHGAGLLLATGNRSAVFKVL